MRCHSGSRMKTTTDCPFEMSKCPWKDKTQDLSDVCQHTKTSCFRGGLIVPVHNLRLWIQDWSKTVFFRVSVLWEKEFYSEVMTWDTDPRPGPWSNSEVKLLSHVQNMTKILVGWFLHRDTPVYYESIKRELKKRLIFDSRCDTRLKAKSEGCTRLAYTMWREEL